MARNAMFATLLLGGLAGLAPAAVIDFTDPGFGAANGLTTYSTSAGGVPVTVTANVGTLQFNPTFGLSINSGIGFADEIDGFEQLSVSFGGPSYQVSGFDVQKLFSLFFEGETGLFSIDGGTPVEFVADFFAFPVLTTGPQSVTLDAPAGELLFQGGSGGMLIPQSSYVLSSITLASSNPVPEPSALLAFAVAGGLGLLARRRAARPARPVLA